MGSWGVGGASLCGSVTVKDLTRSSLSYVTSTLVSVPLAIISMGVPTTSQSPKVKTSAIPWKKALPTYAPVLYPCLKLNMSALAPSFSPDQTGTPSAAIT